MIHNLVMRRLRYALNLREDDIQKMFALVDHKITQKDIHALLKKETEEGYVECNDQQLTAFLDGLIIKQRGPSDNKPQPATRLNNNLILKKIRIALELREEDLLALMQAVSFPLSKSELSALFRKPGSRNYKPCGDQLLRNMLLAICEKYRPSQD
ncbi:DUF1456 family protein [Motilimonas pumila]|uniref:DUF1456 family protein n=1 Tax=Motilimonas pumila TaxID=2303987 RepID=A0A418YFZ2_9GAMM|nr:DUF1456 family protein [Motilimonas pumila]RJG48174.1 DUF1456 family protein [Motilimonas pumila]